MGKSKRLKSTQLDLLRPKRRQLSRGFAFPNQLPAEAPVKDSMVDSLTAQSDLENSAFPVLLFDQFDVCFGESFAHLSKDLCATKVVEAAIGSSFECFLVFW